MVPGVELVSWLWVPIISSTALVLPPICVFFPTSLLFEPLNWHLLQASLVTQMVKNLPAVQETQVRFLSREDPLVRGTAAHSSILAWRIPWTEAAWRAAVHGVARVGHDLATEPPNHHYRLLSIRVICVLSPDCLMGWVLERRDSFSGLKTVLGTLQAVINVCRLD